MMLSVAPRAVAATPDACPWAAEAKFTATISRVYVDGQSYDVTGADHRAQFENLLLRCDREDAIPGFRKWRNSRRLLNITVGLSVPAAIVIVGLVSGPVCGAVFGLEARRHRDLFLAIANLGPSGGPGW